MKADGLLHMSAARTKQGCSSSIAPTAVAQHLCCVKHAGLKERDWSLSAAASHSLCKHRLYVLVTVPAFCPP